jgi:serine/threonine protein kinase
MSNKNKDNKISKVFERIKIDNKDIKSIGKVLGQGAFGQVRDIIMTNNNRLLAGKLIKKRKGQKSEKNETEEEKYGKYLRGKNIININKIVPMLIEDENYILVLMEKASLRDLGNLNQFFHASNLLKIINKPFDEALGDNLLRFYSKQIITALELLDRNYYVHNDIKPQNILITNQLIIKLTDFSFLTKVKDEEIEIPGGTPGYLSPEYYINKEVDSEVARKQDYFALGSTLYYLKYGKLMLRYNKENEKILIADEIIKLLEQQKDNIKSEKMSDGEFINFLCSLIEYKPDDRPCFEEIYRNIWLNNNLEQINNIHSINQGEEEKMLMELQKSDFLIKKEKEYEQDLNLENEQKSKENKNIKKDIVKKKKNNKLCRFRLKKRINN